MEVEWNHLRAEFKERSAKRAAKTQLELGPDSEGEPETGKIDNPILDLNADEQPALAGTSYTSPARVLPPTGVSPLQPATSSSGIQTFLQPTMPPLRSAAFKTVPVVTPSTTVFLLAAVQPTLNQDQMQMVFASAPELQRLAPPQTHTLSNRTCK